MQVLQNCSDIPDCVLNFQAVHCFARKPAPYPALILYPRRQSPPLFLESPSDTAWAHVYTWEIFALHALCELFPSPLAAGVAAAQWLSLRLQLLAACVVFLVAALGVAGASGLLPAIATQSQGFEQPILLYASVFEDVPALLACCRMRGALVPMSCTAPPLRKATVSICIRMALQAFKLLCQYGVQLEFKCMQIVGLGNFL